jgi:hypothetical protein
MGRWATVNNKHLEVGEHLSSGMTTLVLLAPEFVFFIG